MSSYQLARFINQQYVKYRITSNKLPKAPNKIPHPADEMALPEVMVKSDEQLHLLPSKLRRE